MSKKTTTKKTTTKKPASPKQLFVRKRKFALKGRLASVLAQLNGICLSDYLETFERRKVSLAAKEIKSTLNFFDHNSDEMEKKIG